VPAGHAIQRVHLIDEPEQPKRAGRRRAIGNGAGMNRRRKRKGRKL
jgi:hypothetical protein